MPERQEDTRDVFEKALDIGVPAVTGALGAIAARKLYNRAVWQSPSRKAFHANRKAIVTFSGGGAGLTAGHYGRQQGKRRK